MKLTTTLAFASLVIAGCGSSSKDTVDAGPQGPGVAYKCDSSGKDAFDTYGLAAFVTVNEAIFANVTSEGSANGSANLGTSFGQIGMGSHDPLNVFEGQLAAFLVFAYGGPASITYTDNQTYIANGDMVTAHTGFGITAAQYNYFVTNIVVPALTSSGVKHGAGGSADPDDVSSCFAPVITGTTGATFMASVVGH
jgi:hypothetical protein